MNKHFEVICHQDDPRWLEERKKRIGASEIWRAMTSPFSLYAEKIGAVQPPDISQLQRIKWGKRLEAVIGHGFCEDTGRDAEPYGHLLFSKEYLWAACTPDWVVFAPGGSVFWPLEIKNISNYKADDWVDGLPDYYMAQVQMQMLVTGAPKATIVGLIGGNELIWQDIDRDQVWINKIIYHGEKLWNCILSQTPPETDGSAATTAALNALYPEGTDEIIALDADLQEVVATLEELKKAKKFVESGIDEVQNRVKAALGHATKGVFPDGSSFSWKLQSRPEHVVKAASFRVLRYSKAKES